MQSNQLTSLELLNRIETAVVLYRTELNKHPKIAILNSDLLRIIENSPSILHNTVYMRNVYGKHALKVLSSEEAKRLDPKYNTETKNLALPLVLCREGRLFRRGFRLSLKKIAVYSMSFTPEELMQAM